MFAVVNGIEYPSMVINGSTYVIEEKTPILWTKLGTDVQAKKIEGFWHFDFVQKEVFPITIDGNKFIVSIPVNGTKEAFQLDTGSYTSIIPQNLADTWKLEDYTPATSYGLNSSFSGFKTKFDTEIAGQPYTAYGVIETGQYNMKYPLLGADFFLFNKLNFELNLQDDTLSIWQMSKEG